MTRRHGSGSARDTATSADLAALQGTWMVESLRSNGASMPRAAIEGASIGVTGDHFISHGMGAPYQGTFVLDAATKPKSLDMLITAGHAAGTRHLGIYEISDGRWTMCLARADGERPTRFSSTAANGSILQTLQRGVRTEAPSLSSKDGRPTGRAGRVVSKTQAAPSGATTPLEGKWAMVSGVFNGAVMAESMVKWCTRVTQGDVTSVLAGPRVMLRARFSLDAGARPWTIDYVNLEGSDKGKAQQGIAELEDGTLRICMAPPGGARPSSFASAKGDKRSYTTWKRG